MQSTGQTATQAVSFVPMHGWAMMWAMKQAPLGRGIIGEKRGGTISWGEECKTLIECFRRLRLSGSTGLRTRAAKPPAAAQMLLQYQRPPVHLRRLLQTHHVQRRRRD